MKASERSALGIIFPNSYDKLIPEITAARMMASVPFAARYRMIDFMLSSMSNSNIDNIYIMVNKNYNSLIDHIGSAREWDLVRKSGGVQILPPYSTEETKPYKGRIAALAGVLDILRCQKEKYVVLTDTNIAYNIDFTKIIQNHIDTGADVTVVYKKDELPERVFKSPSNDKGFYYTYEVDETGRVIDIGMNKREHGIHNFSLNILVVEREMLIDMVNNAYLRGMEFFERDILLQNLSTMKVYGYEYEGYISRISSIKGYFDENMKLLDDENLDALFGEERVYTKVRDDNPTRYIEGCKVKNVMAADGCVIEGEVENSILFRGVHVKKGAKVKNCILMQDTIVGENTELEYVITDKLVTISNNKNIHGADSYPTYVAKKAQI